jgi:hypothetical protein
MGEEALTRYRLGTRIEKIFVALAYALAITALVTGIVARFSDDLGLLATAVLWAALVPLCLVGVVFCGRAGGIRPLLRRR